MQLTQLKGQNDAFVLYIHNIFISLKEHHGAFGRIKDFLRFFTKLDFNIDFVDKI